MFQKRAYYYFLIQKSHLHPRSKINASNKNTVFILYGLGTSIEFIEPLLSMHSRYCHVFGHSIYAHAERHTAVIYAQTTKKFCSFTILQLSRFVNVLHSRQSCAKSIGNQMYYLKSRTTEKNLSWTSENQITRAIILKNKIPNNQNKHFSKPKSDSLLKQLLNYPLSSWNTTILRYFSLCVFTTSDRISMTLYILTQKDFQNPKSKSSHKWFWKSKFMVLILKIILFEIVHTSDNQ